MRVFSHWENIDVPRLWGGVTRTYRAVYVDENEFFNMLSQVESCGFRQVDSELGDIRRDTQRMNALRQKFDAEAAMLDSYIKVARKKAELAGLLELMRQPPPRQVSHRVLVQIDQVR